ncbi:MAG: hypothetical protein HRT65_00150 [Flavobacteriaceae bacterium]|nr:hypothetical protein [Flavobacteriaceae bacterium]
MAFTSETAAIAGRKSSRKGIANEKTKALKEKVDLLLESNWNQLIKDLNELEPKERVSIIVKLMEFGLPKLSRSHVEQDVREVTIKMDEWGK